MYISYANTNHNIEWNQNWNLKRAFSKELCVQDNDQIVNDVDNLDVQFSWDFFWWID